MVIFSSFKDVVIKGLYTLVPILICIYVLSGLYSMVHDLTQNILMLLPQQLEFAKSYPGLAAIILIALMIYVVGLLMTRTRAGRTLTHLFENMIPGYQLFKRLLAEKVEKKEESLKPCIVKYDDSWSIGYEVESLDNGMVVVFLPGSPSIASGSVQILKRESIQRLDLSKRDAATCLTQFGIGSAAKLNGKFD